MAKFAPGELMSIAADARKFAQQFSGLLRMGDALAQLGSVEQAADEAQARLDKLKADHAAEINAHESVRAEAQQKLESLKRQLVEHDALLTARRAAVDVEIKAKVAERDGIGAMVEQARRDAAHEGDEIKAKAMDEADALIERARKKAADVEAEIVTRRSVLASVQAEIDAAKRQHAEVKDQHARFLASIGAKG